MTVLDHIKQLSHSLTPSQREYLAAYLKGDDSDAGPSAPVSLRGTWKGKFPDEFDLDTLLLEIRSEWKGDLNIID